MPAKSMAMHGFFWPLCKKGKRKRRRNGLLNERQVADASNECQRTPMNELSKVDGKCQRERKKKERKRKRRRREGQERRGRRRR